ncbi:MAG: N-Acetyl-D-glucosamine ABC transport system, permease protein 2 [Candidatus Carbobacillus altaicus]|uniref:N-Acetyl-D-glucosamine ABC transport system, permease protein 2 n=1 Tax=Candidatus Carbonibacillus altaicus TaxID=2163959 RepID=A0A2R6Y3T0_9BACL|nr:MAG: N-Acetyl-D-glucosamine ABC transport system, permease protein 2 [Candidatus Carbobacillus altaicus]
MFGTVNHRRAKTLYRRYGTKVVSYALLILLSLVMIVPFLWTLSTSLKGADEAIFSFPPKFIPEHLTFENYKAVWKTLPIPLYLRNSLILTFFGVLFPVFFSSLAAFPLARMEFKGRRFIFVLVIATMIIPVEVTMIPIYLILNKLGLIGTYAGVILPNAVSTFGIFLMRQAFLSIPREIEESAFIDGANVWQIWWKIMLPMVRPMMATLAILSFIASWNNFLWPLLLLDDSNMYPLTLGLYKLQGVFVSNMRYIAAGSIIALIPIMIVFISLQRYFAETAFSSSIKG